MADYIDREKLLKSIPSVKDDKTISLFGAVADIICIVNSVPKEDVAPVVHAKWGEYEAFTLAPSMNGYPCGNCGMHFSASVVPILNFCPNCGAKMDAEQEE